MEKKNTVFIVDDHQMFRDGLKFLLAKIENIEIIGEAENGLEFLKKIENLKPDIVLMDISMPELDGVQATKKALQKYPDLKIIALSMFGDEEYYYKMIHAGVKGFVLKESGSNELEVAINLILDNQNFFSEELLRNIIFNIGKEKNTPVVIQDENSPISKRELEVLQLICSGLSTVEIGIKLNISKRTVEGHKSSLIAKTSTRNSVNLIMYAIKNNLVEI
jgi:DNA-binding NarL/FixJ family response regulator